MARWFLLGVVFLSLMGGGASADPVTFKDRRVTILVGYAPGGGADLSARLIAPILARYLPGNPGIVVQNMPGAEGIKAINYFATQVKPDGLTIYVGSANEIDPVRSRSSVAVYDLKKLNFIGGNVRSPLVTIVSKAAKKRLTDASASPVTMGTVGFPRSSGQMAAWGFEYLGWHGKWVTGYKGTTEVAEALERGEIDMIAGNTNQEDIPRHIKTGNFEVLAIAGATPPGVTLMPEFAAAPLLPDLLAGKIEDPIAKAAFEYWLTMCSIDKWFALPAGTPPDIVAAHRQAFLKLPDDPEFRKGAAALELILTGPESFEKDVAILDKTPQPAVDFMASLLRKQGLDVAQ